METLKGSELYTHKATIATDEGTCAWKVSQGITVQTRANQLEFLQCEPHFGNSVCEITSELQAAYSNGR